MAYQNKHRSFLPQQPDTSPELQSKLLLRDPPRRLKTIKEFDLSQGSPKEGMKGGYGKGNNAQGVDMASTSPYAASRKPSLNRSKSLTKVRSRNPAIPKQITPEKERPSKLTSFHTRTASMNVNPTRLISTPIRLNRLKKKNSDFSKSFDRSDDVCPPQLSLSFSNSFNTLVSAAPDGVQRTKESSIATDIRMIYQGMMRKLKMAEERGDSDWRGEMEICSKAFGEVAAIGSVLGTLLDKIKSKYEGWIHSFSDQCGKSQLEISALQDSLLKEIEEKKALKRKFEKISRENIELCRTYETYQNKCFEYQEKLTDIANVSLEDFPPTEKAWRLLLSELETYKVWKDSADREFRAIQSKERKLLELLHAIKKRGFPVEDVYNSDVKKPKHSVSQTTSRRGSDDLESERFVTGPPVGLKRPDHVPVLKMEKLEHPISSEVDSLSQPSTLHDSTNGFILYQIDSSTSKVIPSGKKDAAKASNKGNPQVAASSSSGSQGQEPMGKSNDFSKLLKQSIEAAKH